MKTAAGAAAIVLWGFLLLGARPASAQTQFFLYPKPLHVLAADYEANTYVPPVRLARKRAGVTAEFLVTYEGFTPEARQAFAFAIEIWSRSLTSPVPIRVQASFTPLEENVLGSAAPRLTANFPGAPARNTWYPIALAEAIAGTNVNGDQAEIHASFNSDYENWYFGTDGQAPTGTFDFVSVVLHELGHGLGFTGSFLVDDGDDSDGDECPGVGAGFGCVGLGVADFPVIFDRFTEDASNRPLLDQSVYPDPSAALGSVLQSRQVFFDGSAVRGFNDIPVDLYAPQNFEVGSSFSHLDEQIFPAGNPNSLMTPLIARSEAIHSPGGLTCSVFQDIGWAPGPDCIAIVLDRETPPTIASQSGIQTLYPNPATNQARAVVTGSPGEAVRVAIFDLSGRERAVLFAGSMPASGSLRLDVTTASYPAGVYALRALGQTFSDTRLFVHL